MIIKSTAYNTPFIMISRSEITTLTIATIIEKMRERKYSGCVLQTPKTDEGFGYLYNNIGMELAKRFGEEVDIDVIQKDCTFSEYETDKVYRFKAKFNGSTKIKEETKKRMSKDVCEIL